MQQEIIMKKLMDGNKRFAEGKSVYPRQCAERKKEIIDSHKPFVAILCCSDSRVPPELIFDQGLGDLFVVRVAGNIVSTEIIASLEYAVLYLGVSMIFVLGHEVCGAVQAAIDGKITEGNIALKLNAIRPAVEMAKTMDGDLLTNAAKCNVKMVTDKLRNCEPILKPQIQDRKIYIAGGYYNFSNGLIDVIC